MNGTKFDLNEEFRRVPWWAFLLAGVSFLCFQWLFHVYVPEHGHNPPPFQIRVFLGLLVGFAMTVYFLLLGYVNVDAKRRGMNRVLWTAIVMLVPNGIGFILYFFLRQPIVGSCPACGTSVQSGFNFCPKCNHKLVPTCGVCQRALRPGDTFCPYCGAKLDAAKAPVSS
jgi:hypothetical protein